MARSFLVKDILDDIEFEILQGNIASPDLKKGIESVRAYQNKARSETFEKLKLTDPQREIFSRQFQITDMLLNILMELALAVQSTQQEARRIQSFRPARPIDATEGSESRPGETPGVTGEPLPYDPSPLREFDPAAEVDDLIRPESIMVEFQAQPVRVPIIGWLLTKLRILYQRPAYHYMRLLAYRQAEVNRALGERILSLQAMVQAQQAYIESLQGKAKE